MSRFEPQISGVGSDRSTNRATTTAHRAFKFQASSRSWRRRFDLSNQTRRLLRFKEANKQKNIKKRSDISACPAFFLISCKTLFRFFAFARFGKCDNFFCQEQLMRSFGWFSELTDGYRISQNRSIEIRKTGFFRSESGQFTSKDRFEILGRNLSAALSTNLGLILTKEEMGP